MYIRGGLGGLPEHDNVLFRFGFPDPHKWAASPDPGPQVDDAYVCVRERERERERERMCMYVYVYVYM
jgi:hypothetical protein